MSIEICSSLIATHSLSHTDTHITRPLNNQIGDVGAQHLATALRENKVMSIEICSSLIATHSLFHTDTHITTLQQSNRCCGSPASRHCSAREQGDVDRDLLVSHRHPLTLRTQTLTSLNLRSNQIGDVGAQHLATALRENKVMSIEICSSLIATHSLSHTDTHITRPP